jgi:Na+/melibiose symporter-like transporter
MFLSTLAISVEAVLTPFMGVHFWGLTTEKLGFLPLASMIGLFCGFPLVPLFTRLFDKKYSLIFPALFISINTNVFVCLRLLEVPWFPDNDSELMLPLLTLRYFLSGLALPLVFATLNSMFGDIADEIELTTGQRREGVIFATRSFTSKATAAVGTLIGGIVLDVISFPSQAAAGSIAEDIVWKLGLTEGPLTSIFTIIGVLFYAGYKIDQSRHREIRSTIAAKQSS